MAIIEGELDYWPGWWNGSMTLVLFLHCSIKCFIYKGFRGIIWTIWILLEWFHCIHQRTRRVQSYIMPGRGIGWYFGNNFSRATGCTTECKWKTPSCRVCVAFSNICCILRNSFGSIALYCLHSGLKSYTEWNTVILNVNVEKISQRLRDLHEEILPQCIDSLQTRKWKKSNWIHVYHWKNSSSGVIKVLSFSVKKIFLRLQRIFLEQSEFSRIKKSQTSNYIFIVCEFFANKEESIGCEKNAPSRPRSGCLLSLPPRG